MSQRSRFLIASACAVLATACGGLVDPGPERQLGVIAHHDDPVVTEVPDTVEAGAVFEVSVLTFGGGCIGKDGTDVRVEGRVVDVLPYDVHSGADFCTGELRLLDHRAEVTLEAAGTAEIRFHGIEMPANSVITVVRSVVVVE